MTILKLNRKLQYAISAPEILKAGLPCAVFWGVVTIIFILSQMCEWNRFEQIDNKIVMAICFMVFCGFTLVGIFCAAYGYLWRIEFDEQEVLYRSVLGITKNYKIEDITRCVEKRKHQYIFYKERKKLFLYEIDAIGDTDELIDFLRKRNICLEKLVPSKDNYCIIKPMVIQKMLPILGCVCSTILMFMLLISKSWEIWTLLIMIGVIAIFLYYIGDYLCDKVEIKGDMICRKQFLRKRKTVYFREIEMVYEWKSKLDKEYFIIFLQDGTLLKIRKYNENIGILLDRLREEKIKFK